MGVDPNQVSMADVRRKQNYPHHKREEIVSKYISSTEFMGLDCEELRKLLRSSIHALLPLGQNTSCNFYATRSHFCVEVFLASEIGLWKLEKLRALCYIPAIVPTRNIIWSHI